jgi:hypothetical protein
MAGAGKKTFTAGEVLTASDVNTYLMEQSVMNFAGTAARSSAIPTPTEGMVTYNQTNNSLEAYNGTDWINKSGLQLVKKQTIGNGVTSVAVTNCFSATYENYLIKVTGGVASGTTEHWLALTGITSTVYYSTLQYNSYGASTPLAASANNDYWNWCGNGSTSNLTAHIELTAPFLTKVKTYSSKYMGLATGNISGSSSGFCNSTASATGFSWIQNTGTMTGGTIYVYGYGV